MRLFNAAPGARGFAMALAVCMMMTKPASAAYYTWTLSGGGDSGSGFLTTGAADNGGVDITSFGGEIDGTTITGLLGGQPGGGEAYSPSGAFVYDNILYPQSNSVDGALLDTGGILFAIAGGEGNIWGNFGGAGGYSYYTSVDGSYFIQNNAATFAAVDPPAPVPEPAPIELVAVGLVGVALTRRRRRASPASRAA